MKTDDAETLARIAEDTAAIRETVERMETRDGMANSGSFIPDDLPPTRFARSKVYRDTELRQFVTERLQAEHEVKDIRIAAVKEFGEDRVPSLSSIHRFTVALRKEIKARRACQ